MSFLTPASDAGASAGSLNGGPAPSHRHPPPPAYPGGLPVRRTTRAGSPAAVIHLPVCSPPAPPGADVFLNGAIVGSNPITASAAGAWAPADHRKCVTLTAGWIEQLIDADSSTCILDELTSLHIMHPYELTSLQWMAAVRPTSIVLCFHKEETCLNVFARAAKSTLQGAVQGAHILLNSAESMPKSTASPQQHPNSQQQQQPQHQHPQQQQPPPPDPSTMPDIAIGVREYFFGRLTGEGEYQPIAHPRPDWCLDANRILQRIIWHHPLPADGRPKANHQEVSVFLRRVLAHIDLVDQPAVAWLAADADDLSLVTVQMKEDVCAADVSAKYYKRRSTKAGESVCMAQFHQLQWFRARFRAVFDVCYDRFKFVRSTRGPILEGCETEGPFALVPPTASAKCRRSHNVELYHHFLQQAMDQDGVHRPIHAQQQQQPPQPQQQQPHANGTMLTASPSGRERGRSSSRSHSHAHSPARPRRLTPSRSRSRDRADRARSPVGAGAGAGAGGGHGGSSNGRVLADMRHPDRRVADNAPRPAPPSPSSASVSSASAPSMTNGNMIMSHPPPNAHAPPPESIHYAVQERFGAMLAIEGGAYRFTAFPPPSPIEWNKDDLVTSVRLVLISPNVPLPPNPSAASLQAYLDAVHGLLQRADAQRDISWLAVDALDPTIVTVQLRTQSVSAIGFMASVEKKLTAQGLARPQFYPTTEYQTMTRLQPHRLCPRFFSNLRAHGRIRGCDQGEAPACARGSHDIIAFNRAMADWERAEPTTRLPGMRPVAVAAPPHAAANFPPATPLPPTMMMMPSTLMPLAVPMTDVAPQFTPATAAPAAQLFSTTPAAAVAAAATPFTAHAPASLTPAAVAAAHAPPVPFVSAHLASSAPAGAFASPAAAAAAAAHAAAAAASGVHLPSSTIYSAQPASSAAAVPMMQLQPPPPQQQPQPLPVQPPPPQPQLVPAVLAHVPAQAVAPPQPQPALAPTVAPVALAPVAPAAVSLSSSLFEEGSLFGTSLCPEEHYPLGSLLFDPSLELERVVDQPPTQPFRGTLDAPYDFLMPARDTLHPTYRRELDQRGDLSAASRLKDGMFAVGQLKKFGVLKDDSALRLAYRLGADQQYQLLMHFLTTTDRDDFVARLEARLQAQQQAAAAKAR